MAFGKHPKIYRFSIMNSISLPFYQQLLTRLNQMSIRGNRHKMSVYVNLNSNQQQTSELSLIASTEEDAVVAFHMLFERNNGESEWRLMTPLRFAD